MINESTKERELTLRLSLPCLSLPSLASARVRGILSTSSSKRPHGLLEIVLSERALFVDNEVHSISTLREHVMLERGRAKVGIDDVARLVVEFCDPLCELHTVGDSSGEENVAD